MKYYVGKEQEKNLREITIVPAPPNTFCCWWESYDEDDCFMGVANVAQVYALLIEVWIDFELKKEGNRNWMITDPQTETKAIIEDGGAVTIRMLGTKEECSKEANAVNKRNQEMLDRAEQSPPANPAIPIEESQSKQQTPV